MRSSQILLGDRNATYLCSKTISTLIRSQILAQDASFHRVYSLVIQKYVVFTWFKKKDPLVFLLCMYHISLGIIEPRDLELTCTDLLLTKK